ncbi:hypothetical protein BS78_K195900 [Paspalum vaginatum]|uniref:Uncharacterized protein n=1 Tax=Paspalum vaginatum TaxID=158149 RepID=A0A9W7XDW8_9POAL|nr:hypothetical protein BS78_K195900 [Paspalum vaginatum]
MAAHAQSPRPPMRPRTPLLPISLPPSNSKIQSPRGPPTAAGCLRPLPEGGRRRGQTCCSSAQRAHLRSPRFFPLFVSALPAWLLIADWFLHTACYSSSRGD